MLQRPEMHLKKEKSGINMNRLVKGMWWYNEIRIIICLWYILVRAIYLKDQKQQDLYDYGPREIKRQQGGLWLMEVTWLIIKTVNFSFPGVFLELQVPLGILSIVQWLLYRGWWSSLPMAVPDRWHPLGMTLERKGSEFHCLDPFKSSSCQLTVVKVFAWADCSPTLPFQARSQRSGRAPPSSLPRRAPSPPPSTTGGHSSPLRSPKVSPYRTLQGKVPPCSPDYVCVCYLMLLR